MTRSILFHIPKPIEADTAYGSKVRPYKLLDAFRSLGCNVELIAGAALERKKIMTRILSDIRKGAHYDFLYSESSNAPIPISDSHHLPLSPWSDYYFFREIKKYNINSGLYYRDVFWKFPVFNEMLSLPLRLLSLPLYKLDWKIYSNYINHLFLPSKLMSKYLHTQWPDERLSTLPPGCDIIENAEQHKPANDKLTCFYVGGIAPPIYNLKAMLDVFQNIDGVKLVLCCREEEWFKMKHYYGAPLKNVEIIHESNRGLIRYYSNADLFICAWGKDPYMKIAMPVKIFESLGYSLPIIITEGSEAARFVSANDIGWVINNASELVNVLDYLKKNRNEISKKRITASKVRLQNSWTERARTVIDTLARSK